MNGLSTDEDSSSLGELTQVGDSDVDEMPNEQPANPFHGMVRHGYGVLTCPNGDKYSGNWQNDFKHGQGKMSWSEGKNYEG
mmetsp:Transcript_18461/g.31594  ORF Transcript_18461/g.31594 Transcript_18461/m.31594 type:complete len:81 (+) Transcript_18461:16-258(+)